MDSNQRPQGFQPCALPTELLELTKVEYPQYEWCTLLTVYFHQIKERTKGKWLSGRKRQTVNLLGNSRWFESNLSHSLNKGEMNIISSIKHYNINIRRVSKFNILNKDIYLYKSCGISYVNHINKENSKCLTLYKYCKSVKEINSTVNLTVYKLISTYALRIKILVSSIIHKLIMKHNVYKHRITQSFNIYHMFLNFKKNRFFPYFYKSLNRKTIFNNSLGILSRKFSHKKSFLKSKNAYLFSASYIRRMLIYISTTKLNLNIQKTPKYLKEILRVLMSDTNVIYNHPFQKGVVNEKETLLTIKLLYVNFTNNKSLGPVKKKKKGRLKRKISKKIILYNNVLD